MFSLFIVHVIVDIILRLIFDIFMISLVGGAVNGDYRCLLYLSILLGVGNIRVF